MEKTPFILHEKFCSDNNEQRKEHFQKEFERYIVDSLSDTAPSKSCAGFGILEFEGENAVCCAWTIVHKKKGANHESSNLLPPEQRR